MIAGRIALVEPRRFQARSGQPDPHLPCCRHQRAGIPSGRPEACHPLAQPDRRRALRENEEANRLFIAILTSRRDPALILRRMNEAGVLGRFIPEFGKIVSMMQFNMYHHYTVDEHLLRAVDVLSRDRSGQGCGRASARRQADAGHRGPRQRSIVAVLLHDVAKGRPEDHSIAGAKVARKLGPAFRPDARSRPKPSPG